MTRILADEFGKKGIETILFAAPQTPEGNYKLLIMPSSHGLVSYDTECFPYDEYRDLLLSCDYIIDQSATCKVSEEIWFWDRDWLKDHTLVFARNGTEFWHPRPPVNSKLHGVALSRTAKKIAVEKWKVPEKLVHVIPYGINMDFYTPGDEKKNYFLYIGAPRKEKGIFTILDIAEKLPDEEFVLSWRAHTEEHKQTEKGFLKALEQRELENVEFWELPEKDQAEEKVRRYQKAKAFLQPNIKEYIEAFGLASCEALACSTPVIRERHGSAPEIIKDGVHGFLCESLDEYTKAIRHIDEIDPRKCRARVEKNYSKEKMASEFLDLYEEIAHG